MDCLLYKRRVDFMDEEDVEVEIDVEYYIEQDGDDWEIVDLDYSIYRDNSYVPVDFVDNRRLLERDIYDFVSKNWR